MSRGAGKLIAWSLFSLVSGLLIFAFAWSLVPAIRSQKQAPCRPLLPEKRQLSVPEVSLQDVRTNEPFRLSDLHGKMVIVNFWATWCEPCIREWSELDQLAQRLSDRDDVVVLAISSDASIQEVQNFLEQMNLEQTRVKVAWDPSGQLYRQLGSEKLPDTYFVNSAGEVTDIFVNVREWGSPAAYHCVMSMVEE